MMKIHNNTLFFCTLLSFSLCIMACNKADDTFKEITKGGTQTYPGKADSVKSFPGNERLKLSFLLISDPKVNRASIFWNNGKDSLKIPITRTTGVDVVTATLTKAGNGITEGTYFFDIYTFDKYNNRSIKVQKLANVYGSRYQSSLLTRPIQLVTRTTNTVAIDWYNAGEGATAVELSYTNLLGVVKDIVVPVTASQTTISDFKIGTTLKYRTLFLPEPLAIDTFYTDYTTVVVN
jgi:hypothetical protein